MKWLIWSIEHGAWWGPNQTGYYKLKDNAGRYSKEDAVEIVMTANKWAGDKTPNEAMIPELETAL